MAIIQEVYISEAIHDLKAHANRAFAAKDYDTALSTYLDVLSQLPAREPALTTTETSEESGEQRDGETGNAVTSSSEVSEPSTSSNQHQPETEEQQQIRHFRSVIYANVAAVHLKLEQYRDAVKACNQSLIDQPNYVKALYRRAQANQHIGGWSGLSSALEDNKQLLKLDLPESTRVQVAASIKELEPKAQQAAEKEKDEMISKLKGLGDSILGNFGLSTNNFKFTQQPGGGYSMNFVR